MYRDSDRLLYAISAKAEISWAEFKRIFDYLYALPTRSSSLNGGSLLHRKHETIRAITALGHCDVEFNESGGKIFVAPPSLARLPVIGLPQAILTGSRSPLAIKQLSEACEIVGRYVSLDVSEQAGNLVFVPSRVVVQAESMEQITQVAGLLRVTFEAEPPAWKILNFAGCLDDYLISRQWSSATELNWRRKDFDLSSLRFGSIQQESVVRLSRYTDPVRNIPAHRFWKDGQQAQVDRDWGRYAVLREAGLNVLVYDQHRFIMAIPVGVPLPRLFAQSLALCSGYAAQFISRQSLPYPSPETKGFNLFRDIPPQIAEMVAAKLGQTLLPYSLDLKSQGDDS